MANIWSAGRAPKGKTNLKDFPPCPTLAARALIQGGLPAKVVDTVMKLAVASRAEVSRRKAASPLCKQARCSLLLREQDTCWVIPLCA